MKPFEPSRMAESVRGPIRIRHTGLGRLTNTEAKEEDKMSTKLVIALVIAALLLGAGVGAGGALVLDDGEVGPRGQRGVKGPPGPPGIYADVGVLEARIANLNRRLARLERRRRARPVRCGQLRRPRARQRCRRARGLAPRQSLDRRRSRRR